MSDLEPKSEMSLRHRIETIFWGRPPADPAERKLLIKLDLVILSYVCLNCEWTRLG
jgi:ACS family pantothenate transporter-like MFS transporter